MAFLVEMIVETFLRHHDIMNHVFLFTKIYLYIMGGSKVQEKKKFKPSQGFLFCRSFRTKIVNMEDENRLTLNRVVESPCRKWMQMRILIERYAVSLCF